MTDANEIEGMMLATGVMQHVEGMTAARFEREYEYAKKAGNHMWTSLVRYLHTDEQLKKSLGEDGEPLLMDRENLVGHDIFCFICEEPATRQLLSRRCKGEPKGTLRYV